MLKTIRLVGNGTVTAADVRALGDVCAICGDTIDFATRDKARRPSLDHVVPRALGGTDDISNLQLSHFHCNQRKHVRCDLGDFGRAERQRFYRSREWREFARSMREAHPTCAECGAASSCVDHVVAIADGGAVFDIDNAQALCRSCHNRKSQREYYARCRDALVPSERGGTPWP
jgi:5-methylcytosine-specific restriction protein A